MVPSQEKVVNLAGVGSWGSSLNRRRHLFP